MKNFKIKNLSKRALLGVFVFQFAVTTSFAPIIARAQVVTEEMAVDTVETVAEPVEISTSEEVVVEETTTDVPEGETTTPSGEETTEPEAKTEEKSFSVVGGGGHDPVDICHAAGQSGNYIFLTVDDDGAYGGHGGHENDILPITDVNGDREINQADCDYQAPEEESCDASINLFDNSGFENPVLPGSWNIYADGTSGLAWDVEWQAGSGDNTPAKAELQQIYTAHSGEQYLELDSDFDGPGGSISNEEASTRISQTITTVPGQEYEISYFYSARPGYGYDDNKVGLYIDGFPWDLSVTTNGVGDSDTFWAQKFNHFTADSTSHTITFADLGTANSFGMFLDDMRVNCVEEDGGGDDDKNTPPDIDVVPEIIEVFIGSVCDEALIMGGVTADDLEDGNLTNEIEYAGTVNCNVLGDYPVTYNVEDSEGLPAEEETRIIRVVNNDDEEENPSCDSQAIWARVVVTSYSNVGAGDMTNTIYLGSSINTVTTGEWFPVSPADVQNIENFADVSGLAVKRRVDNKIVLELHGSHLPKGTGKEYADGYIEFFNAVPSVLVGATGQNKLELNGDNEIGHQDIVWIDGDKANFNLGVGTADDRFSTTYTYSLDEECDDDGGGDNNNPPAIVLADECILWSEESFNFTSGVTTSDADGDTVNLTYVVSPDPIVFGQDGTYTITYTADDGEDTTVVSKTLTIDEDCEEDNGGGGGDDEEDNGGGGGGGSSGSILGGGGSNRQGEVLGATTAACAQFTQYHDTGSTQSEVRALQTFLNEYMDAGLTVNGTYDWATTQAIHDFQALHWDAIIKPWLGSPSKISPNTTGRTRQTTTQALNFIINCPNDAMYLEDPQIFYKLTEIKNKKEFSADQIMKITNILDEVHGIVLGAEAMEK